MIKKILTSEGIAERSLHESFITMLDASITWTKKWSVEYILSYWYEVAFDRKEVSFDESTIDKIRTALLIKGGIKKPILKNTKQIKKIKQSIKFEE